MPNDPFKIVIVRDMWLTGFDAPCLHTMYVDKPMRGHGLMQAIARVNRVFKDKPGGLVVDYLGLADELKQALATYTESGGTGETAIDQEEAVAVMLEKYEICCGIFHGFDWSVWTTGTPAGAAGPPAGRAGAHPRAGRRQGPPACKARDRAVEGVRPGRAARRGTAQSGTTSAFFQAVQAVLAKRAPASEHSPDEDSTTPSGRSSRRRSRPTR